MIRRKSSKGDREQRRPHFRYVGRDSLTEGVIPDLKEGHHPQMWGRSGHVEGVASLRRGCDCSTPGRARGMRPWDSSDQIMWGHYVIGRTPAFPLSETGAKHRSDSIWLML